jgi:hypothetical protein
MAQCNTAAAPGCPSLTLPPTRRVVQQHRASGGATPANGGEPDAAPQGLVRDGDGQAGGYLTHRQSANCPPGGPQSPSPPPRNAGLASIRSAFALMFAKPTLMSLAQNGTRPQRMTSKLRAPALVS